MSFPASAVTVELPRWPLADRLSLVLACAVAPVAEAVLARYPGVPGGIGVLLAAALVGGLWLQRRSRPGALELTPAGDWLRFRGGDRRPFRRGPGSRLLGTSVIVHWRSRGASGFLWLTPADLPRETLRKLAARLAVAG